MTRTFAAALVAGLLVMLGPTGTGAAPERCSNAKTCSQARLGCIRHCLRPQSPQCRQFCTGAFNDCMATGTFPSKFCGPMPGLAKR